MKRRWLESPKSLNRFRFDLYTYMCIVPVRFALSLSSCAYKPLRRGSLMDREPCLLRADVNIEIGLCRNRQRPLFYYNEIFVDVWLNSETFFFISLSSPLNFGPVINVGPEQTQWTHNVSRVCFWFFYRAIVCCCLTLIASIFGLSKGWPFSSHTCGFFCCFEINQKWAPL